MNTVDMKVLMDNSTITAGLHVASRPSSRKTIDVYVVYFKANELYR